MKVEVLGNREGRLCVFNCLETERGKEIYREMIEWLTPVYEVHCVWHDGSRYEYDGMAYMKGLVERECRPCLYLHTKGACNIPYQSMVIRRMWKSEFGDVKNAEKYFEVTESERAVVAYPVQDHRRIPLYNGFVVSVEAMRCIEVKESEDRYVYERLWMEDKSVDMRPMRHAGSLRSVHIFIKTEYDLLYDGRRLSDLELKKELMDTSKGPRIYWVPMAGKMIGGVNFDTPMNGGYACIVRGKIQIENIEGSKAFKRGRVKRIK